MHPERHNSDNKLVDNPSEEKEESTMAIRMVKLGFGRGSLFTTFTFCRAHTLVSLATQCFGKCTVRGTLFILVVFA